MKAAILPLGLTVLLATAPLAYGQVSPQENAVNEAVMRQAARITLRQKLEDARAATARHDLAIAAKLYDDAWELVQKVGANVDPEAAQTRAGLTAVRLELARQAQHRSNYLDASTQIADALRVDPANAEALDLKQANDKLLAMQVGRVPDPETLARA